MDSKFEEFQKHLQGLVTQEKFDEFVGLEGRRSVKTFSYEDLVDLMNSEIVVEQLQIDWSLETKPEWEGRTINFAVKETILQALAAVSQDAELVREEKRNPRDLTVDKWQDIEIKARFASEYFRYVLGDITYKPRS